ncbi:MAG: helix-turn-helix transcriptional regulator [Clostridia bacterium]|nr:helix-turn-helix transcriptional regulator [Clostridia bacterium]
MTIGSNIKKLRRERDITQEQLAEFLHLTPSAISQWETDRVLPDIQYLPKLAHLFKVSSDEILGINVEANDEEINRIYQEVRELWCTARRSEAEKLCREGIERYPNAYILMEELAFNLSYSSDRKDIEESIALFERIRSNVTDESTRNFALGNLVPMYMKIGEVEKAKQMAESVPSQIYTKADCRLMTLRGADWAWEMSMQINVSFDDFVWKLRNLLNSFGDDHPMFTIHELLTMWQKIIDFVNTFYENGDFGFQDQLIINAQLRRAKLYIKLNEEDNALSELEKMCAHINHFDKYSEGLLGNYVLIPKEKWPTSLLVRPRDENDPRLATTVSSSSTENEAMEHKRILESADFDTLRKNERFQTVYDTLSQNAKS